MLCSTGLLNFTLTSTRDTQTEGTVIPESKLPALLKSALFHAIMLAAAPDEISRRSAKGRPALERCQRRSRLAHQLPAGLLLGLLGRLQLVVLGDVAVQRAHHDHGHHAAQEQHDHQRVDDAEPVDLVVRHQQVRVPPRRPPDVALLHGHAHSHHPPVCIHE